MAFRVLGWRLEIGQFMSGCRGYMASQTNYRHREQGPREDLWDRHQCLLDRNPLTPYQSCHDGPIICSVVQTLHPSRCKPPTDAERGQHRATGNSPNELRYLMSEGHVVTRTKFLE